MLPHASRLPKQFFLFCLMHDACKCRPAMFYHQNYHRAFSYICIKLHGSRNFQWNVIPKPNVFICGLMSHYHYKKEILKTTIIETPQLRDHSLPSGPYHSFLLSSRFFLWYVLLSAFPQKEMLPLHYHRPADSSIKKKYFIALRKKIPAICLLTHLYYTYSSIYRPGDGLHSGQHSILFDKHRILWRYPVVLWLSKALLPQTDSRLFLLDNMFLTYSCYFSTVFLC